MLFHSSTGMPVVDAREDFLRARRAEVAARAARWVAGGWRRARVPRTLTDTAGVPRGAARLEVIPLKAVVDTLEPTIVFDAAFRPASALVRARWERIALAHLRGVSLPPIRRNIALLSGAVAANTAMLQLIAAVAALATGAVVLVTIPALWILRGGPRRHALQMDNEGLRRRACTSTRGRLNLKTTR